MSVNKKMKVIVTKFYSILVDFKNFANISYDSKKDIDEPAHSVGWKDNVPETDVLKDEPKAVEEDEACESCTI